MYKTRVAQFNELASLDLRKLLEEQEAKFIPCGPFCTLLAPMPHFVSQGAELDWGAWVVVLVLTESSDTILLRPRFVHTSTEFEKAIHSLIEEAPSDMFLGDWIGTKKDVWKIIEGIYNVKQYFSLTDLFAYSDEIMTSILDAEFPNGKRDLYLLNNTTEACSLYTKDDVKNFILEKSDGVCYKMLARFDNLPCLHALCFVAFDSQKGFVVQTGPYKDCRLLFDSSIIPQYYESVTEDKSVKRLFVGEETNSIYAVDISDIGAEGMFCNEPIRYCSALLNVSRLFTDSMENIFKNRRRRHIYNDSVI